MKSDNISENISFMKMKKESLVDFFIEENPLPIVIVNSEELLEYVNKATLDFLQYDHDFKYQNMRFGSVFLCSNSVKQGGCGHSEFCKVCGGFESIKSAIQGFKTVRICKLYNRINKEYHDFKIHSFPYNKGALIFLEDISEKIAKESLERAVFFDIYDTLSASQSYLQMLRQNKYNHEKIEKYAEQLITQNAKLLEYIQSHKDLSKAEKSEYQLNLIEINAGSLVKEVAEYYLRKDTGFNKVINIDTNDQNIRAISDKSLLRNSLEIILKNALEASSYNQHVTISYEENDDEKVIFKVHNESYIPEIVQKKIYQRSFSTKEKNRGFGTYTLKIFVEKYLQGNVYFESNPKDGTNFFIEIPKIFKITKN